MSAGASLRRPEADDLDALAATVHEGFDGYRAFAPPGWEPPGPEAFREELARLLPREDFWCLFAEVDGRPAAHVAFMPAAAAVRWPADDPGLAHLFQLFVRAPFQGSGVASELHARAVEAMRARGFARARLFTPAGQLRARRFYEREGWRMAEESFRPVGLGLELQQYRRDVA